MDRTFMASGKSIGCILVLLAGILGVARSAEVQNELAEVWNYLAEGQSVEARVALRKADTIDQRERALAGAILTLSRSPVAGGRVPEIDRMLADLAIGTDEISVQALYLRGRLHQIHTPDPDFGQAEKLYRELSRRWPASHWAQLGLVKLGLMQLYALHGPAAPADRLAEAITTLEAIVEPELRRDLQLQIGWAGLYYDRPLHEVLPHLVAAEQAGGLQGLLPEDLVLQIGELSSRAGHTQQARTYFQRFLREFPVSPRRYNVQQRLAELEEREGHDGGS